MKHINSNPSQTFKKLDPSKIKEQTSSESKILIQFIERKEKEKKSEKIFSLFILFLLMTITLISIIKQIGYFL